MIDTMIACPFCDYECCECFSRITNWNDGEYADGKCPSCNTSFRAIAHIDICFETEEIEPAKEEKNKDIPGQMHFWDWENIRAED